MSRQSKEHPTILNGRSVPSRQSIAFSMGWSRAGQILHFVLKVSLGVIRSSIQFNFDSFFSYQTSRSVHSLGDMGCTLSVNHLNLPKPI